MTNIGPFSVADLGWRAADSKSRSLAESTVSQALNNATDGANVVLAGRLPAADDRYIDRLARHIAIRIAG
jgi:hypothetical protein